MDKQNSFQNNRYPNQRSGNNWNANQNYNNPPLPKTADRVPPDYVDEAEKVMNYIYADRRIRLTTSQLRNLLSLSADIYNQAERCKDENLPAELTEKIEYLRIRMIYESGRTPAVKKLVDVANLLSKLKNVNGKKSEFIKFNRYMEALVAYHRFLGGRD